MSLTSSTTAQLGLHRDVANADVRRRTVDHFRKRGIALPTFDQLAHPEHIPASVQAALKGIDPDAADPKNLYRVHWCNDAARSASADQPGYIVLPSELTGVQAPIAVVLGDRFPMIRAHKVLAAYACLVPRLVTGVFDPVGDGSTPGHRAIWPSTGNYCRGGVAISRILGCHGVAVLPEGMSAERFRWLDEWVEDPSDIVRTPGSESNVKEIYDACAELAADPTNLVFNQFCEFANHLVHHHCTGRAMERVFRAEEKRQPGLQLSAFVSATGSAGTIAAGDFLKERYGSRIVAAEAEECPTMLYNGFGEHNIQGIGDKHIPLIHNVMNTDIVVGISDRRCDTLNLLFNTEVGRTWLAEKRGLDGDLVDSLQHLGLSSICNVLAAIKVARHLNLGPEDMILTVATDGAEMYTTEQKKASARFFPGGFDAAAANSAFDEHLTGLSTDHLLELSARDRDRIFNLGYFTWVEQQGLPLEVFEARRRQTFWRDLRDHLPIWDELIQEFNQETGVLDAS